MATLEGQLFKHTGVSTRLSEQNLVDCVYGSAGGCNGGWMDDAFLYVKTNGGIDNGRSYPVRLVFLLVLFKKRNFKSEVNLDFIFCF